MAKTFRLRKVVEVTKGFHVLECKHKLPWVRFTPSQALGLLLGISPKRKCNQGKCGKRG